MPRKKKKRETKWGMKECERCSFRLLRGYESRSGCDSLHESKFFKITFVTLITNDKISILIEINKKANKNEMWRRLMPIIKKKRNENYWESGNIWVYFYDSCASCLKNYRWSSIPSIKRIVQVHRGVDVLAAIVAWYLVFFGTRGSCSLVSRLASRALVFYVDF